MLKVVGTQDCSLIKSGTEFGEYLPFQLTHGDTSRGSKLYWRTGDLVSTLLEVEINAATGAVDVVSLILPGHISSSFPEFNVVSENWREGCPITDVENWPESGIKDEPNPIRVYISGGRLLIALSDSIAASRTISIGNATYGVGSNDSLVWLLINHLPEEKLRALAYP